MKKLHNKLTEKNQHSWILMEKLKKEAFGNTSLIYSFFPFLQFLYA